MKLSPTYLAAKTEPDIYELWEKSGIFTADPSSPKEHFSIAMPPPNETGTLHIGHALGLTLQDILARHERLKGRDVLWLPGTDHSALATNTIIEEKLRQEGTDKHQLGRQAFIERTKEFVSASRSTINEQIRAMGASVDWSRSRYTLSPAMSRLVSEVFVRMYNDGLIYRGSRIVNWDPLLETNVSDDEVEYITEAGQLYTLKYGPFEITTARPETKFGDKYVVMHPDDPRYSHYKEGDQFETEWLNGKVTATVIKDEAVDQNFGTGVMTITPWHSQIDFEIAKRHQLDREQIIDLKGRLLPVAGDFSGLTIKEARTKIVEKLKDKGLLVKIEDGYKHNVAINSRGHGLIEPQIRLQWFIDVNKPAVAWHGKQLSLKEVMQAVIRDGDIKIIPGNFDKLYFHWIDNLRDWCISRQIWWGHQIPAWYKEAASGQETYVGLKEPAGSGWQRDPDTLDTWFSSALWTFATLIDQKLAVDKSLSIEELLDRSPDFLAYHPTSVMETAWDILFFWVARMIMLTTYATSQIPFKTVYLHGLVLSESGGKMSKSKPETIIDPMEVIPEYGTDALRLALVQGMSAAHSQKLVKSKVVTNRNFANKLWNIARYIEGQGSDNSEPVAESLADHWILGELITTKDHLISDLDHFRFSDAYSKLYHFIWDDLADWYVEASKTTPNKPLINYVFRHTLIIAHSLAPFVTETIWQSLYPDQGLLAAQSYHKLIEHNQLKAKQFEKLKVMISETRKITQAIAQKDVSLFYVQDELIDENRTLVQRLARLSDVKKVEKGRGVKLTGTSLNVWLDIERGKAKAYLENLKKDRTELDKHIARLEYRLRNKSYLEQAPEEIVIETKAQLAEYKTRLSELETEIKLFKNL